MLAMPMFDPSTAQKRVVGANQRLAHKGFLLAVEG